MTNVEIFVFCEINADYHLMNGKMKESVLRLINYSVFAVNNSGTRLKLADVSKRQRQRQWPQRAQQAINRLAQMLPWASQLCDRAVVVERRGSTSFSSA